MTDYVIPVVFDGDKLWRRDYLQALCRDYNYDRGKSVWRSMGNEELLVRCIRTFMPFVGTIVIVLSRESQWRDWMNEDGIRVVYHRSFIPQKHLPVFNAEVIRKFIPAIPGLSSKYIIADRFTFPLSPVMDCDEVTRLINADALKDVEGMVNVFDIVQGDTFEESAAMVSAAIKERLQTYLEKTNYGKRTASNTAGDGCTDAAPVSDEQRRDGGDNTPHEEKVQDQMAEKRPADKTDPSAPAQAKRGKGAKNNGKRGFGFNPRR